MWNLFFLLNNLMNYVMIACIKVVCKFHTYNSKIFYSNTVYFMLMMQF